MCKYDFALSFAGADREVAEEIALKLIKKGIRVFYDTFEAQKLWGANLVEEFHSIYSKKSKFCIILISEKYLEKMWTTHERKSALQKQLEQRGGYILPIKIDDSSLPGLPNTIGYISLKKFTIDQIVEMAQLKLGIPILHPVNPEEPIIISKREDIRNIQDTRLKRHGKKSKQMFSDKLKDAFYQLHSISKSPIQIDDKIFHKTFLNHSKRYSEALFYSGQAEIHLNGYTKKLIYKDPDMLVSAVTCYYDGHIITEGCFPNVDKFNPNFFYYVIHGHLQLTKEIFISYLDDFNFITKLMNLDNVSWIIYDHSEKKMPYSGYHEDIIIQVKIDEINGRDKWNNKMDVAVIPLQKIARIFSMDRLPQNYWDENGIIDYSKYGFR